MGRELPGPRGRHRALLAAGAAPRDLTAVVRFAAGEEVVARPGWSPRLSRAFLDHLRTTRKADGGRVWSDRTINRMVAHLKRFARWVHSVAPLPLGDPVRDLRQPVAGPGLDIERALTEAERRRLLDVADTFPKSQGRSRDRHRNPGVEPTDRPLRPSARHAMGRRLIKHTGNIAAVQRQLGHPNAVYSIQYSRVTEQDLRDALDGTEI